MERLNDFNVTVNTFYGYFVNSSIAARTRAVESGSDQQRCDVKQHPVMLEG